MAPILTTGAGSFSPPAAVVTVYTYVGSFTANNVTAPSTSMNIGAAACRVIVGVVGQNVATIVSVVVDGVTLTSRCDDSSGDVVSIRDGALSSGAASRTVTVTWNTAASLDRDFFVWTVPSAKAFATGLSFAGWTNFPASFAVSAGDMLFSIARNGSAGVFKAWSTSTVAPTLLHTSGAGASAADWNNLSANGAFLCYPDASGSGNVGMAYAVYR